MISPAFLDAAIATFRISLRSSAVGVVEVELVVEEASRRFSRWIVGMGCSRGMGNRLCLCVGTLEWDGIGGR